MAKTTANISIDTETKQKAQELFADFGLDLSTAINLFLKQSIRENAIPFMITRDVPNADTIAAIREAREFKAHPDQYKRYSSFKDVLSEVLDDA